MFIGRTNAKVEAPLLWLPGAKNWFIGKDSDTGKDWRQEEKGTMEDETVVWHHRLNGHKFEQTPGDGEGQGSLVCCSSWGHKELDTTEWLNNTVKGEAKVDVFLQLPCFLHDSVNVSNLISGSSASLKSSLESGKSWFTYYLSLAWRILSITLVACEMSTVVQ